MSFKDALRFLIHQVKHIDTFTGMVLKDEVRFLISKVLRKKTVIFSRREDWKWAIRNSIKRYTPFFYEFNEVNLNRFDLAIPLTENDAKYFNSHFRHLKNLTAIIPANEVIEMCEDKLRLTNFLIQNEFVDNVPRINDISGYPYVLKKKCGENGKGTTIITDPEIERRHLAELQSDDYFKQAYVEGKREYAAHLIMHFNKLVFSKTIEHTFSEIYFAKGDNFTGYSHKVVDHRHLGKLFEKILNKLGYQGICCIDYKIENGRVRIFEINARCGRSLAEFMDEAIGVYSERLGL